METFAFGRQTTKIAQPGKLSGRARKRGTAVRPPSSLPPGTTAKTSGKPSDACALPGTVPVEKTEHQDLTVTSYERKKIVEAAYQRQQELPEFIIMENAITL